jgi:phage-related protein
MADQESKPPVKQLEWVGSSKANLVDFPVPVRKEMGHSLHLAQAGERPTNAKPLRGFGGAGVLELVESHSGNAYRAVYTVKFARAVYVLHVFQKKSKKGIATPRAEIEVIRQRLRTAAEHYEATYGAPKI